jgi:hypothetical protein
MAETHFLPLTGGRAGPGGLTILLTEATASWDLIPGYLTVSGGAFWAPFGILNQDWLVAQNVFSLVPRAAGAFPLHWNERGVRINGAHHFSETMGVNYVLSVGNGVEAFAFNPGPADANASKSVMGRVGFFPGFGTDLDIGASFAAGALRDVPNQNLDAEDPVRYPSRLVAFGLDASYNRGGILSRAYYVFSREDLGDDLSGAPAPLDISRHGAMVEGMYAVTPRQPLWVLKSVAPKARLDFVALQRFSARAPPSPVYDRSVVTSIGANLYPNQDFFTEGDRPYDDFYLANFYLSLEYHHTFELGTPELANDRFVARLTGRF